MNKVTQSIYKNAADNSLFDSNGKFRFIVSEGNPRHVSGMTIKSCKWSLNGSNLMFEIAGTFTENLISNKTLCVFELPEWIISKIATPYSNVIDLIDCKIVFLDASATTVRIQITTDGANIFFTNVSDTSVSGTGIFKIRYNTIIDY